MRGNKGWPVRMDVHVIKKPLIKNIVGLKLVNKRSVLVIFCKIETADPGISDKNIMVRSVLVQELLDLFSISFIGWIYSLTVGEGITESDNPIPIMMLSGKRFAP